MGGELYKERYKLAPHMREYDEFHFVPCPYLMYRAMPNYTSPVISADKYGLRRSTTGDGSMISGADISNLPKVNVVLGGSAAFGWGATGDSKTIASALNRLDPGTPWINLGGCTYQTLQEAISLLMYVPPEKIGQLVMFSGVNAAFLTLFETYADANIPFFFKFSEYWNPIVEHEERKQAEPLGGVRNAIRNILGKPSRKTGLPPSPYAVTEKDPAKRLAAGMERAERDLMTLTAIARGFGFQLTYFFQPCLVEGSKTLSREEREIISILDSMYKDNNPMRRLGEVVPFMAERLKQTCAKQGVGFYDLRDGFTGPEWLYVDRVHLTDLGYERAAGLIHERIKNGK
ncbi:MAG: SGNH/GDSL hydrolase family protein [Nitrospinae bacterium]|nr:SGNH/GDSL hydrolase family protein [Nitrospinota bacterium]